MVAYRRNLVPGGTCFFTVTLTDRSSTLLVDQIGQLREAFRKVKMRRPFEIDSIVILPDHLHCIWTLPRNDADYALRSREIKSAFSRRIPAGAGEYRSQGRLSKKERGIWQRRYWEHTIRDEQDLEKHMDYVHYNPVKHGYVTLAADWPYSSFHRLVRKGVYNPQWGMGNKTTSGSFGE
jgi:putative transposase